MTDDQKATSMLWFGLCCIFLDQPITAIGRMNRPDTPAKLARFCAANAEALLAVGNG